MQARSFRLVFAASGLAAVAAVGCSLALDFDESKIPVEDTGITGDDSAVPDTGTDTNKPDTGGDTTDTNDTTPPPDTLDSTPPPDTTDAADATDTADSTVADTTDAADTTDSATADTTDSGTADTGADTTDASTADTTDSATADTGTDTADSTVADTADAGTDTTDAADTTDAGTDTTDTADSAVADTTDAADTTDTADAAPVTSTFLTVLTNSQETPPIAAGTTTDSTATFTLNETAATLTYTINHNVLSPTSAHFHTAFGGVAAAPTFDLGSTLTSPITGTWTGLSATNIADLKAGKIYVNVHNAAHSTGEVRGQLVRPGETFYTVAMNGGNETPPVTTSTNTGTVQFVLNGTTLTYNGTTTFAAGKILASGGAHIHSGAVGVAGGVVYDLTVSGSDLIGAITGITAGDVTHLGDATYYVNVHTTDFTGGEIRGQIIKHFVATPP